jgi:hypothetical protein
VVVVVMVVMMMKMMMMMQVVLDASPSISLVAYEPRPGYSNSRDTITGYGSMCHVIAFMRLWWVARGRDHVLGRDG